MCKNKYNEFKSKENHKHNIYFLFTFSLLLYVSEGNADFEKIRGFEIYARAKDTTGQQKLKDCTLLVKGGISKGRVLEGVNEQMKVFVEEGNNVNLVKQKSNNLKMVAKRCYGCGRSGSHQR